MKKFVTRTLALLLASVTVVAGIPAPEVHAEDKLTKAFELLNNYADTNPEWYIEEYSDAINVSTDDGDDYYYINQFSSDYDSQLRTLEKEATRGCTTDYDKIKGVCMYLANYLYYDFDRFEGKDCAKDHDTYAQQIFEDHSGVCEDYALMSYLLLNRLGIACMEMTGDDHRFNAAYSETKGRWIVFDATWCSQNGIVDTEYRDGEATTDWFDRDYNQLGDNYHKFIKYGCDGFVSITDGVNKNTHYVLSFANSVSKWKLTCTDYPENADGSPVTIKKVKDIAGIPVDYSRYDDEVAEYKESKSSSGKSDTSSGLSSDSKKNTTDDFSDTDYYYEDEDAEGFLLTGELSFDRTDGSKVDIAYYRNETSDARRFVAAESTNAYKASISTIVDKNNKVTSAKGKVTVKNISKTNLSTIAKRLYNDTKKHDANLSITYKKLKITTNTKALRSKKSVTIYKGKKKIKTVKTKDLSKTLSKFKSGNYTIK